MKESVRNEIVRLSAQGLSGRRIAQQLRVSRHTVQRALHQVATARDQGVAALKPAPGRAAGAAWMPSTRSFSNSWNAIPI